MQGNIGRSQAAASNHNAAHYRKRAAEIREVAKGIFDGNERGLLRDIAKEYEQFAREAERK